MGLAVKYIIQRGLIGDIREADDGLGDYSSGYVQVSIDLSTGRIFGTYHYSVGRNERTEYHDPGIIPVGNYAGEVSRAQLVRDADMALAYRGLLESEGL